MTAGCRALRRGEGKPRRPVEKSDESMYVSEHEGMGCWRSRDETLTHLGREKMSEEGGEKQILPNMLDGGNRLNKTYWILSQDFREIRKKILNRKHRKKFYFSDYLRKIRTELDVPYGAINASTAENTFGIVHT